MKLKTRIAISYFIIIVLPIVLMCAVFFAMYHLHVRQVRQNYGITSQSLDGMFSNSMMQINQYTRTDYEELSHLADADPAKLTDTSFLKEKNSALREKRSFLLVRTGDTLYYQGDTGTYRRAAGFWIKILPAYGTSYGENEGYLYSEKAEALIKQVDFTGRDGSKDSIFIVTSSSSVLPEVKSNLILVIVSVIVILAATASLLMFWLYQSIMKPLKELQVATKNIKEGNLDFTLDSDSRDEIGDLFRNFDEMRQRLKESTEEKIEAEKENRALISNIAHDIKTPITAVKGYAEGLIDGVAATPEKRERYIRTIYNKASEMDALINELTLYSKIDTNRIPYNFQKLSVSAYFNDCIEEIGLDLETKDIRLNFLNYVDDTVQIIADPEQLMRVVNNIVSNAVKYMDKEKGMIFIRIRDVGDFIQVEIEDNGKGIALKDLPYIFDRFYRTDSSRNSSTGGSGIGLSIVKKIIEDHGGKIWATSKEHIGTTMYFVLRKYQEVPNE